MWEIWSCMCSTDQAKLLLPKWWVCRLFVTYIISLSSLCRFSESIEHIKWLSPIDCGVCYLRLRPSSLFGVTHWINGKRRMSYYFPTFRNLQQCSVCFIGLNHVYVLNETGVYLFTPLYIKRRLVHAYNAFTNEIVCGVIYCVKLLIACRDCTWQAMSRPSIQCNMYTILRFFWLFCSTCIPY